MRALRLPPSKEEQIATATALIANAVYQQKKAQAEVDRLGKQVAAHPDIPVFKDILYENQKWLALETGRIERYTQSLNALESE